MFSINNYKDVAKKGSGENYEKAYNTIRKINVNTPAYLLTLEILNEGKYCIPTRTSFTWNTVHMPQNSNILKSEV